jgi:ABC-type multidrug transport system fused ATPase/permease subunit
VDGPEVLHDITLEIKSGERIGVVGRTGSGKSSLTLALLRLIPTKGAVMYDGIVTENINLNALRAKITISASSLSARSCNG